MNENVATWSAVEANSANASTKSSLEDPLRRPGSVLVCSRIWPFPSPKRINYCLHFSGHNLDIMRVVFVDPFVKVKLGQMLS
jgi:hypothetical protein